MIYQVLDYLVVPLPRSKHERCVSPTLCGVDIGTLFNKHLDRIQMALSGSHNHSQTPDLHTFVDQIAHDLHVTVLCSAVQSSSTHFGLRFGVSPLTEQIPDDLKVVVLSRQNKGGGTILMLLIQVCTLRMKTLDLVQITGFGCL